MATFDPPIGSVRVSLAEAASRQVDAAIDALAHGQYEAALTLAGAAEGMIPRSGPHMFEFLKAASVRAPGSPSQREWIGALNLERDWLKHGGAEEMTIESAAAAYMIARAASKLERWTPKMEQFKAWLMANLDKL